MSFLPFDLELQDAQGNALSGATIYICTQPANTSVTPPAPLATVYTDSSGTVGTQPIYTNGFGYAQPYVSSSSGPFTIIYNHPLFLTPLVFVDQYPSGGASGTAITTINASTVGGTITGALNGSNVTFTLPSTPRAGSLIFQYNGQVLTQNLSYTLAGAVVTMAIAPSSGETLTANYIL